MPNTFPNQRTIKVNREVARRDFLGIKNDNWQAAARDLGAHALMLYMYLASNADGYNLALSPVAVRQAIGMARSTYHDQFHKLVDKGYLVPSTGNTFEFYEVPKAAAQTKKEVSEDGLNFENDPCDDNLETPDGFSMLQQNIEINNHIDINKSGINIGEDENTVKVQKPKVKEIVIPPPKAEGKKRPSLMQMPKKAEFVF